MKKCLTLLLVAVLLVTCIMPVSAAGSISLKGPSTVRAGDTITLTFSAGGGIYGGSGSVSYDASQLTLKKYEAAIGGSWVVEFSGNKFVFYDNNMSSPISSSKAIFKATFAVKSSLKQGTDISVSVKGVKLSDGNKDMSIGNRTYKATIAPPKSGNCKLASLTVSNAKLSPGFSENVTSYTASVPFTTESLKVKAKAQHSAAKVTVKNTKLKAGATTKVTITVKAENGATKTYTIKVERAQDPNYVPSENANLKELSVEGVPLSPGFSPEVGAYYVWLPYEMDSLRIKATPEDSKAKAKVGEATGLEAGKATAVTVTVTAESGKKQTYTITAVRAPALADTEDYLAGKLPEPETEPTVPETVLEPTTEVEAPAQPQPKITMLQIIVLSGGGVLCLVLGIFLGSLLTKKRKSNNSDLQE